MSLIQRAMAERNAVIPEDRRIEFRIGINVMTHSGRRCVNFAAMQSKRSLNDVVAYVSS